MPSFGARSKSMLETCDARLDELCHRVIQMTDFAVICGARGKAEQDEAFRTGRSRLQWPRSKHNAQPPELSRAVDIAPWHGTPPHIRWSNEREFVFLSGCMITAAHVMGIGLRWGGNWDEDADLYDRNVPFDLVHYELTDD